MIWTWKLWTIQVYQRKTSSFHLRHRVQIGATTTLSFDPLASVEAFTPVEGITWILLEEFFWTSLKEYLGGIYVNAEIGFGMHGLGTFSVIVIYGPSISVLGHHDLVTSEEYLSHMNVPAFIVDSFFRCEVLS
ncbi:hypothetical protein Tco_0173121 [Tanacetum coccineum]